MNNLQYNGKSYDGNLSYNNINDRSISNVCNSMSNKVIQYMPQNNNINKDLSPNSKSIIDELAQSTLQKELNWVNQQFLNMNILENNLTVNQNPSNNKVQVINESFASEVIYNDQPQQIKDYDEDDEFNKIAKIYFSVNLIQRSYRVLKANWLQSKKTKSNTNDMPVQILNKSNRVISQKTFDKENIQGIYDMTFEQVLKQDDNKSRQKKVDPLYSGLINLEAIEESLQQFESISKSSMSSLLRNRNKSPFSPHKNSNSNLPVYAHSPNKMSTTSLSQNLKNIQPSPDKQLEQWVNQDLSKLPSLRFSKQQTGANSQNSLENSVLEQTPYLNGQVSIMSFCQPQQQQQNQTNINQQQNDQNQQTGVTRNDMQFLQVQRSQLPNHEDFSTAQSIASHINIHDNKKNKQSSSSIFMNKRRSSVGSIDRIKDSILEINLILGINKIRSFLEKNDQRKRIQTFHHLSMHAKLVSLNEKVLENDMIARSLANDSILQTNKLEYIEKQKQAKLIIFNDICLYRESYQQKYANLTMKNMIIKLHQNNLRFGFDKLKQNYTLSKNVDVDKNKQHHILQKIVKIYSYKQKLNIIQMFQIWKSKYKDQRDYNKLNEINKVNTIMQLIGLQQSKMKLHAQRKLQKWKNVIQKERYQLNKLQQIQSKYLLRVSFDKFQYNQRQIHKQELKSLTLKKIWIQKCKQIQNNQSINTHKAFNKWNRLVYINKENSLKQTIQNKNYILYSQQNDIQNEKLKQKIFNVIKLTSQRQKLNKLKLKSIIQFQEQKVLQLSLNKFNKKINLLKVCEYKKQIQFSKLSVIIKNKLKNEQNNLRQKQFKSFFKWYKLLQQQNFQLSSERNHQILYNNLQAQQLFTKLQNLTIKRQLTMKQQFISKLKQQHTQYLQNELKQLNKERLDQLQNQINSLHKQIGLQISDKIEFMHDYMLDITQHLQRNSINIDYKNSSMLNINQQYNQQEQQHQPLNRIEAIIAFRYTLDKLHMKENITDKDILKFFSAVMSEQMFKVFERCIDVKRDIFGESNARHLLKLINQKKKKQQQQQSDFSEYDILEEGKLSLDSLALYVLRQLQQQNQNIQFNSFMQNFKEIIQINNYQQYHRFDLNESQQLLQQIQDIVDNNLNNKQQHFNLRQTYQDNLIKELENQITLTENINRLQTQQTPLQQQQVQQQQHKLLVNQDIQTSVKEFIIDTQGTKSIFSPQAQKNNRSIEQNSSNRDHYISLTSEKENNSKQKQIIKKKGSKNVNKKLVPPSLHTNLRDCCEKLKKSKKHQQSPIILKKNSLQSCMSNISSSSDLMSFRRVLVINSNNSAKKKIKKISQSSQKIKQQSLELTKLSQKVQEMENKITILNSTTVAQQQQYQQQQQIPQKTIIEIREKPSQNIIPIYTSSQEPSYKPSVINSLQSTGLQNHYPIPTTTQIDRNTQQQHYFNIANQKQHYFNDENRNHMHLITARRYDNIPLQQSQYSNNGIRLGQSLDKYDHIRNHQKCTSKFCLICKQ